MSSRIEWQWRDRPSGPAYRQRVQVHDDPAEPVSANPADPTGPVEAAWARLAGHCVACLACRTVEDYDHRANATCDEAEELYQAWRQARRASAPEGSPEA
ncbi:hypothetical protein [Streptomyces olivochromogenes]|uniref:Uncharacterized protein n=1 Tax=Streptomyces olivochromogenes TaxID=1963 RepID=A0A250VFI4_STROL|nr:hypothetical protein [Streptomyces olivochromogenes]KUN47451.1 hypothetical protein AQJ27_10975 [Streptomyces olivochromogenes]GAX52869.1 hypothetical protein SO3561_04388 [Streptomyces olivochromogenes]